MLTFDDDRRGPIGGTAPGGTAPDGAKPPVRQPGTSGPGGVVPPGEKFPDRVPPKEDLDDIVDDAKKLRPGKMIGGSRPNTVTGDRPDVQDRTSHYVTWGEFYQVLIDLGLV